MVMVVISTSNKDQDNKSKAESCGIPRYDLPSRFSEPSRRWHRLWDNKGGLPCKGRIIVICYAIRLVLFRVQAPLTSLGNKARIGAAAAQLRGKRCSHMFPSTTQIKPLIRKLHSIETRAWPGHVSYFQQLIMSGLRGPFLHGIPENGETTSK